MAFMSWLADFPDPQNFLFQLFHSSHTATQGNYARYDNPDVDRLLDLAETQQDEQRYKTYREAEQKIVDDAPWLFLFAKKSLILINPRVKGLVPTPMDAGVDFYTTSLFDVRVE